VGVHSAKFDNEKDSEAIRNAVLRYGISHPVSLNLEFNHYFKVLFFSFPEKFNTGKLVVDLWSDVQFMKNQYCFDPMVYSVDILFVWLCHLLWCLILLWFELLLNKACSINFFFVASFKVVNDGDMYLWRKLGINSWPTFAIVGPNGKVLAQLAGEGHKKVLLTAFNILLMYFIVIVLNNAR